MNEATRKRVSEYARTAIRYAVCGAYGLWLGDVILLLGSPDGGTRGQWTRGVGAALFVALTTAILLGGLLGPLLVPACEGIAGTVRAWRRRISEDPSPPRALAALALLIAGPLSAASVLVYQLELAIDLDFARAPSIAAATTASHFALALAIAVSWPTGMRAARRFVDVTCVVPPIRFITARYLHVCLFLGLCACTALAAVVITHRNELAAIPWIDGIPVLGLLPGIAAAAFIARGPVSMRPWLARAGLALVVAGLIFGAVTAAALHPESTISRRLAFERSLSGRLGFAAWTLALDFDRDGQINVLGGGDCAPFDAKRHAGAIDIPGNGIDEDCDGIDQPRIVIRPRPRSPVGQSALPRRPTIVLITIDALAAPRLMALGSPTSFMPNLDALAGNSKLFAHCFSQGPSTRLSMPSMFTSRWDSQLILEFSPRYPYPLAGSERQLQDMMNEAGYDTNAVLPSEYFDQKHWSTMTRGFVHVDRSAIAAGRGNAARVTDAALDVLSAPHEKPLYLWVHYYDAHAPYAPLPGVKYVHPTEETYYEAQLSLVDREVGRLIAALEARPEPLYFFVTADHATVFHPNPTTRRAHYGFDLYTATLHVPLIVHGPGILPGRVDGVVSTMDIVPTITDLLQVQENFGLEGTSLFPELLAARGDSDRLLFHEFYLPELDFRGEDPLAMVSVRNRTYNLVLDRGRGRYELFDWTKDYFEMHDLYEEEGRSPQAVQMRSILSSFIQQFHRRPPGAALLPPPGGP